MTSTTSIPTVRRKRAGTKGVARADREEQILDVASRVFGDSGFAATGIHEIAEQAGISKPLIYTYFGSKEGLLEACLVRAGTMIADDIDRTAESGTIGLTRALVTLDGVFTMLEGRPWIWRLFFDPTRPQTPEIDAVIDRYTGRLTTRADEGIAELMAFVGNDDPLDHSALAVVWSSIFDGLITWWLDHPEITAEEMTARSTRLAIAIATPVTA
jgi:AcrR family transcriptional regulator